MKLGERILGVIKERWKEAVVALLVLSLPFTSCYACKLAVSGCIKIEETRDALGYNDKYYSSFAEFTASEHGERSVAERLEQTYGLTLPENAVFIYGRDHGFWRGGEEFFMFGIVPRELPGYREGMEASDVMRLIADDKYDFSRVNEDCAHGDFVSAYEAFDLNYLPNCEIEFGESWPENRKLMWIPSRQPWPSSFYDPPFVPEVGLTARQIEEETMLKPPRYEGPDVRFYHYAPSSHAFRCVLYSTRCYPDAMVFAISYNWG